MAAATEKSEGAFRTIREVADWLAVPTHVLRFWESKFQQIAPVKGAGGRRYYRPEDMRLLGGVKVMLHDRGLTIRAVAQRIDEDGVDPVMALSPDLAMSEEPSARTRRVIRPEEDGDDAVAPPEPPPPPAVAIRKEGGPSPDGEPEAEEMPGQPDADPMPEQPVDTDSAPQPGDVPQHDPAPAPQPVDLGDEEAMHAPGREEDDSLPSDAEEEDAPDLPPPPRDDIEQFGDAPEEDENDDFEEREPIADSAPMPAVSEAPASRSEGLRAPMGATDRRRLRRVVRKLRDMIEDVERELSKGSGR